MKTAKEEKFVKVCPSCFSEKIFFWVSQLGDVYNCPVCGLKNFVPVEFKTSALKKIREKLAKKKKK